MRWDLTAVEFAKIAEISVGSSSFPQQPSISPTPSPTTPAAPPASQFRNQGAVGGNMVTRFGKTGVATPTRPAAPAAPAMNGMVRAGKV